MTDTTPGGFADTPGPDATAEQDADVRALLSFLRHEPLELPADVRARLEAVLAEERRTGSVPRPTRRRPSPTPRPGGPPPRRP